MAAHDSSGLPTADLDACLARIDWATEALHSLNEESRIWFLEHDQSATVVEYHAEADVHVFRLEPEVPPLRFGVMSSNIIHQVRAALDNLVWQLVLLNRREPRRGNRGNSFPIFTGADGKRAFEDRAENALRGVRPDHVTLIEKLQPGTDPRWREDMPHPLAVLARLSNADKHQVLPIPGVEEPVTPISVTFAGEDVDVLDCGWAPIPQRYSGAIVGWARFVPKGPHASVRMEYAGWARLTFGGIEFPALRVLLSTVEGVVNSFLPAFSGLTAVPLDMSPQAVDDRFETHRARDPLTGHYWPFLPDPVGFYPGI